MGNDRLEHFSLVERTNNGSDHVHQFEVLPFHVASEQALRIRSEFKKPAVKLERQYLKLMDMIAAIVGTLDKREMFQSIITHSGRQHAQFGAKPLHFAAFGDALIWGLEQQFGAAFTPQMKEAWIKLYDDVQHEMMRAGGTSEDARRPSWEPQA